jgi:hypothetical protein
VGVAGWGGVGLGMEEARGGWVCCAVVWVVPAFGDGAVGWVGGLRGGVVWVLVGGDVLVGDGVCWFWEGVGFEMWVLGSCRGHFGRGLVCLEVDEGVGGLGWDILMLCGGWVTSVGWNYISGSLLQMMLTVSRAMIILVVEQVV